MAGLEVKVAFGSVWKETLTELSGGQRSLLALSLILSLLLFKPGEKGWRLPVDYCDWLNYVPGMIYMMSTFFCLLLVLYVRISCLMVGTLFCFLGVKKKALGCEIEDIVEILFLRAVTGEHTYQKPKRVGKHSACSFWVHRGF